MTVTVSALTKMSGPTIYDAAVDLVRRQEHIDIRFVMRNLGIGYNLAATCIDRMVVESILGPLKSNGTREVLK